MFYKTTLLVQYCLFYCSFIPVFTQNLVLNPGFEDFKNFVKYEDTKRYTNVPYLKLAEVPFWDSATPYGTCDHHNNQHLEKFQNFAKNDVAPRTGYSCGGFYAYYVTNYNYREYMQGTLSQPLEKGKTYIVSFYLNLTKNSIFATSNIGVYFSTEEKFSYGSSAFDGVIPVTPQVKNPKNQFFTATDGWQKFEQKYTASGGERCFVIGNFDEDYNTLLTKVKDTLITEKNGKAYYYIDDVCITKKDKDCGTKTDKDKPFNPDIKTFTFQKTLSVVVKTPKRKIESEREYADVKIYKNTPKDIFYSHPNIDSFAKTITTSTYMITAAKKGYKPHFEILFFPEPIITKKDAEENAKNTFLKRYVSLYPLDSTREACIDFFYYDENSYSNLVKLKLIDDFLKLNPDYLAIVHKKTLMAIANTYPIQGVSKVWNELSAMSTYPHSWRYVSIGNTKEGETHNAYIEKICVVKASAINRLKYTPNTVFSFEKTKPEPSVVVENKKPENTVIVENKKPEPEQECTVNLIFMDKNQRAITDVKVNINENNYQTDKQGKIMYKLKANTSLELKMHFDDYFPVWRSITCTSKEYMFVLEKLEKGAKITLPNIYFEPNSDVLKDSSKMILNTIVPFLQTHKNYVIAINGHTDSGVQGTTPEFLMDLSARRAKAVMNYLVSQGVDKNMLIHRGFGSTKPIQDNKTPEGRAKNRRTELEIIEIK